MLKLMYITNKPKVAQIAESAGVERIFIDLEFIGKDIRQAGLDTVKSKHCLDDIKLMSKYIKKSEILVRINPIHDKIENYVSTIEEIEIAINNGANIIMLPYFKRIEEVEFFLNTVNGRVKTMLLVETPESVEKIDSILELPGIDYIHIGLNDLSLGYNKKFMFELLVDGTVEGLCAKFRDKGIEFGFGGIASIGKGVIPAEMVIKEHYRLGSKCAILSRSFCDIDKTTDLGQINKTFHIGIKGIRELEKECQEKLDYFSENRLMMQKKINFLLYK